ncbi:GNAT family N-acetyltransferase [Asticcacaulis sp. 201]|uniref:GNAT family N-acetyltransferase n=1 Tax=Asticcacaulis sp. 201 TaxID=3028787 RepID=UPI0029167F97|nr:GNAT family N-acetyltransferase [Asticcacaulis sp. 201]MDV6331743.1 GNAT family N-acetyltransferase [Asticcacaulis sp. 201]
MRLTCEVVKASALSDLDLGLWQAMCQATDLFKSPLLSPEWTQAVASVRDDVYVAIFRRMGKVIGFLPHHRRPHRFARPAGAPFADYSALITFPNPGIDGRQALKLARIDRFQAIGLVDPHNVFGETGGEADTAYGIDLSFDETTNNVTRKHRKNINRHRRNMIEMHGDVGFILTDRDRGHYDQMMRLKREQILRNGLHDFLAPPWATALFERLYDAPETGLHGSLLTMTIGGTPVMFHYGLRLRDRMHPWVSSYDPSFGVFSPGSIFLTDCQAVLKENGVSYYDLSTGQSHYKDSFSNTAYDVRHTRIYGASSSARFGAGLANVATRVQGAMGGRVADAVTRLNRRFDQIACLELDFVSRAKGVAYAFAAAPRRLRTSQGAD